MALLHGCPGDGLVVLPPLQTQRICRMPNKHNAKRRHHIPKMKYSVRNWRVSGHSSHLDSKLHS